VEDPLDFDLTGVVASLAVPLEKAGISVFAISTFDTEYMLVRDEKLDEAVANTGPGRSLVSGLRTML